MFGVITKTALAVALGGVLAVGFATIGDAQTMNATYASVGSETSVPFGWVDFCSRYAGECGEDERAPQPVHLTVAAMKKIRQVNTYVNNNIQAVSDMDHWGVVDRWDYPTDGKGDCEDFALLKRRMLIAAGFPRQALLMTVVKESNGDGHAILTVKTDRGEFALDNLDNAVKPWADTGYRFVKRQSEANQNVWVSLGEPTAAPAYVSK